MRLEKKPRKQLSPKRDTKRVAEVRRRLVSKAKEEEAIAGYTLTDEQTVRYGVQRAYYGRLGSWSGAT